MGLKGSPPPAPAMQKGRRSREQTPFWARAGPPPQSAHLRPRNLSARSRRLPTEDAAPAPRSLGTSRLPAPGKGSQRPETPARRGSRRDAGPARDPSPQPLPGRRRDHGSTHRVLRPGSDVNSLCQAPSNYSPQAAQARWSCCPRGAGRTPRAQGLRAASYLRAPSIFPTGAGKVLFWAPHI